MRSCGREGSGLAAAFRAAQLGRNGAAPCLNRRIAACLFRACYCPVTSLITANYLPVILLFRARRRILTKQLKTNGFMLILKAKTAPEQGEKRDNREKQGASRGNQALKQSGECGARKCRAASASPFPQTSDNPAASQASRAQKRTPSSTSRPEPRPRRRKPLDNSAWLGKAWSQASRRQPRPALAANSEGLTELN
jgi:hypothetical protein